MIAVVVVVGVGGVHVDVGVVIVGVSGSYVGAYQGHQ